MSQRTTVVHVRESDFDVYIGRDFYDRKTGIQHKNVGFGNPWKVGRDGKIAEVIEKYRQWLYSQPELVDRVKRECKNKRLGCFCKSAKTPNARCHGDVLAAIADGEEEPFGEE